jgi:hypothetical protein
MLEDPLRKPRDVPRFRAEEKFSLGAEFKHCIHANPYHHQKGFITILEES